MTRRSLGKAVAHASGFSTDQAGCAAAQVRRSGSGKQSEQAHCRSAGDDHGLAPDGADHRRGPGGCSVGAYPLWRILAVFLLLFLAVLLASAIEPLVQRLRRGPFNRSGGVLAIYTAIIGVSALAALLLIPAALQQVPASASACRVCWPTCTGGWARSGPGPCATRRWAAWAGRRPNRAAAARPQNRPR